MTYQFDGVDDGQVVVDGTNFGFALLQFEPHHFLRLEEQRGVLQTDGVHLAAVDGQQLVAGVDGTGAMGHRARPDLADHQVVHVSVPKFRRYSVKKPRDPVNHNKDY